MGEDGGGRGEDGGNIQHEGQDLEIKYTSICIEFQCSAVQCMLSSSPIVKHTQPAQQIAVLLQYLQYLGPLHGIQADLDVQVVVLQHHVGFVSSYPHSAILLADGDEEGVAVAAHDFLRRFHRIRRTADPRSLDVESEEG